MRVHVKSIGYILVREVVIIDHIIDHAGMTLISTQVLTKQEKSVNRLDYDAKYAVETFVLNAGISMIIIYNNVLTSKVYILFNMFIK